MLASVHFADVTAGNALSRLRKAPDADAIRGCRSVRIALAVELRTGFLATPSLRRVGLVSFWDDDAALDAFESEHPLGLSFANGWRARLAPVRAHGAWPGLDEDTPKARKIAYDGPALVLTLARTKFSRFVPFFRTSQAAEAAAVVSPGLIWGTAMVRPPFLATCSLWTDEASIAAYAFDVAGAAHPTAIARNQAKPFHHEQAFIRFRPYAVAGHLEGRNPLAEHSLVAS